MNLDQALDLCWGKAASDVPGGFHPVLLHMLDVAAVALELLEQAVAPSLTADILAPGLSPAAVSWVVALHDLGKVSPGFQAKVPELASSLRAAGLPFPVAACTDHGMTAMGELPDILAAAGVPEPHDMEIARVVCAHHGSFPPDDQSAAGGGGRAWAQLRRRAAERLREALGCGEVRLGAVRQGWLMALAGLVTVADWIGSDVTHFPYQPQAGADADYVAAARRRAREALGLLGWLGWRTAGEPHPFVELFPFQPTALQSEVERLSTGAQGPTLLLVEAPTGVGKTEASLVACEQLIERQGLGGVFYALPSQATSNQMVGRIERFLRSRYPAERVNLHLVHGLSHLHEGYRTLTLRSVEGPGQEAAAVVADGWFRHRKRALLSPFAVGTVDQAMLGALQVRHFFVRMLGLSRKVVVIDEVHAYDAYMSRILDRLIDWLRELGSSVVLLSATLPAGRRRELLAAWGAQRDVDLAYPRVIQVDGSGVHGATVPAPARRVVDLEHAGDDLSIVVARLQHALEAGGCAAWICNTVRSAQETWRALRAAGLADDELMLFHARFPVDDRLVIERQVLGRFGKEGERPRRCVLVATQVVEQSLDLDFDLMVSEIAPVDLLLQRAGRLHRHDRSSRPAALQAPRLWILGPGGAAPDFGTSKFVYDEHVLLRTWWALRGRRTWTVPDDIDPLIAQVYDPMDPPEGCPRARWQHTAAEQAAAIEAARLGPSHALVPSPAREGGFLGNLPLCLDDPDDGADRAPMLQAKTRDIDETVTVLCLFRGEAGQLRTCPDGPSVDLTAAIGPQVERRLLGRAVTLQTRSWVSRLKMLDVPSSFRRCSGLRQARVVIFDDQGVAEVGGKELRLDPRLGLDLNAGDSR